MRKYVYPLLPAVKTFSFVRIGGSGLANCLFVVARAYVRAKKEKLEFIEPTWFNLSLGTYLRCQSDKRHYLGLFDHYGSVYGIKKCFILNMFRKNISVESGLKKYFEDIIQDYYNVSLFINKIVKKGILKSLDAYHFENFVSVHVRLGDYSAKRRTDISWYIDCINEVREITGGRYKILVFSDGSDSELSDLLSISGVERANLKNAMADILAISKTRFLIGSDSTFSAWGAYLGQVPYIMRKRHFGRVLQDELKECVDLENDEQTRRAFFERIFLK